jgi:hypothetical protein
MYNKEITLKLDTTLGYLYFIDVEHPLATGNSGRVYLHRHLASIHSNKWLSSSEHVHHKDGNKLNNSIDNLEILSAKEHAALHATKNTLINVELQCPICNQNFITTHPSHKYCSTLCSSKSR